MKERWPTLTTLALGLTIAAWGCGGQEAGQTGEMAESEAAAEMAGSEMGEAQMPQADGAALWAYLESVDVAANWQLWPGKGQLYAGQEPHGMLLTTYLSPSAHEALMNGAGSMPSGAIIVKENYMPDSTLAATTVMYKVDGFDPANNNWFWLKRLADGTIEVEGMGSGCITCHAAQRNNDFVFTGSLSR